MGLIICTRHGKRGLLSVCAHIAHEVRRGGQVGLCPEKVELYWGVDNPKPELYCYVCRACGDKIRAVFGTTKIMNPDQWESCIDLAADGGGVCASCFGEVFPESKEA